MMKQEMASEMIKSRSQTESTMVREGAEEVGSLLWTTIGSVVGSGDGSIFLLILYGSGFPWCRLLHQDRVTALATMAARFGLQYVDRGTGSCSSAEVSWYFCF
jgi:hypothetical protein